MNYRWSLAPPQPLLAATLARQLDLSPLLTQCLINRGLTDPEAISRFLHPRLGQLADPFRLPNMTAAVERLFEARARDEPVVIFGDYDVDGVTATALLTDVLGRLGWRTSAYLPHRLDEGYGLSQEGVENCLKKCPAPLLLAVDCGSTAVHTIAWLKARGIEVIVLDHHQVTTPPPPAVALVNPLFAGSSAAQPPPFAELCSVGLAFKLAHALVKHGRRTGLPGAVDLDLRPLLDLVALGTVADVVPLTGENRILVAAGLARLRSTCRPGLVALKQVAQCPENPGVYEVGFQLAPRLNAAGRLETANEALQLLLADNEAEALSLAQSLDSRNRERQKIERAIVEQVLGAVRARFQPERDFVIVEGQLLWHIGVVGIVASRLVQEFYRPVIILGGDGELWRGSGRSIPGFDLAAALRACSDLLERHGGHALAAGLTLRPENLDQFRERLNGLARRALRPEDLQPPLPLDAEVRLADLTPSLLSQLARLQPTGQGNPGVQLCARQLTHHRPLQRLGTERQHVRMWVTDGTAMHEAIWWRAGEADLPVGCFDLAFVPQLNEFNGRRTVRLKVLDWRQAQSGQGQ